MPIPTNLEIIVMRYAEENARLLIERDEWKEKAQAKDGMIQYWRGEVARLKEILQSMYDEAILQDPFQDDDGRAVLDNVIQELGEQS